MSSCIRDSLRVNYPYPNDPPQEPLMRIVWFLSPESLQLFVVEEGLYPKAAVHPQGLELLSQREVCEDHIMDLNLGGLVSFKWKYICPRIPVVQMGIPLQTS